MPLPTSPNAITLANIQTEFGGSNPISISEYYAGAGIVPAGTVGFPGGVSTSIPASGPISLGNFHGATAVTPLGVFFGGNANNGDISLLYFSTETTAASASSLQQPLNTGACGSALTKGYVFGGANNDTLTSSLIIGRYQFSTLTYANTSASMPSGYISGLSPNTTVSRVMNSSGSTMYMNGYNTSGTAKFVVSTEVASTIAAVPSNCLYSGVGYNSTRAYLLGGQVSSGKTPVYTNEIKRFYFATETYDVSLLTIDVAHASYISFNTSTACYNLSYSSGSYQKLTYDTETLSTAGTRDTYHQNMGGFSGNGCYGTTKGYYMSNNGQTTTSTYDSIASYTFSTGTTAGLSAKFSVLRGSGVGSTQSALI
jgi:hypothetical protein